MLNYLWMYLIALVVFLLIDAVWLGMIAKDLYGNALGSYLLDKPKMGVALAFYALFMVGVVTFVIAPAIANGSWIHAALYGGLFGLVGYAAYDLTNLATLKNWPAFLCIIDMVWGTFITAATSTLTFFIFRALIPSAS